MKNIQEKQIKVNVHPADAVTIMRLTMMMAEEEDKFTRLSLAKMLIEAMSVYEDEEVVIL